MEALPPAFVVRRLSGSRLEVRSCRQTQRFRSRHARRPRMSACGVIQVHHQMRAAVQVPVPKRLGRQHGMAKVRHARPGPTPYA